MSFYTYILQSETTGRLYIGQTNDITDRLIRHNANRNKSTANKGPWILLHAEMSDTRAEAVELETKLKSWKNPQKVREWVACKKPG